MDETFIIRRANNKTGKFSFYSYRDGWDKQAAAREFASHDDAVAFLSSSAISRKVWPLCAVVEA